MGVTVTVTLDDQLKPDYTLGVVASASYAIAASELVLFFGTTSIDSGKSFQITGAVRAGELIREGGNVTPLTTNVTEVVMPPPGFKPLATVVANGVLVAPTEDDVAIGYGSAFQSIPGQTLTAHIKRGIEKFIEQRT